MKVTSSKYANEAVAAENSVSDECKGHFVYILECSDGTLYTGYATDVKKREWEHNNSEKGAKYTRYRRPCMVVYTECHTTRSAAMKRESAIKKMTRTEKLALISPFRS